MSIPSSLRDSFVVRFVLRFTGVIVNENERNCNKRFSKITTKKYKSCVVSLRRYRVLMGKTQCNIMKNQQKLISLKLIAITLALFVFTAGLAQEEAKTLLWKIEGKGIKTSYVFGTFHILPQKDLVIHDKVKQALGSTEQLVMELDFDDPALQANLMQSIAMNNGETLDKLLTAEQYKALNEEITATVGVGLDNFKTFKPFFLSTFLIPSLIGEQPVSFEVELTKMATAQGKSIEGLETVAEQAVVFDKIPYEKQAADLMEMVTDKAKMKRLYTDMIEKYKTENIAAIDKLVAELYSPEELAVLLTDRNKTFVTGIAKYAAAKPTFVAVGAGHLGGPKGVIKLLKQQGYTVTPVY